MIINSSAIITFFILIDICIIGAYSTTDIIRLLKGSTTQVTQYDCFCPICNYRIPLHQQIPVISYTINHGRCANCGSKIPAYDICLEIFIIISFSVCSYITSFTSKSFILCIIIYEILKIFLIIINGHRDDRFIHNFTLSILLNIPIFCLLGILFFLKSII